jgi:hypothetical protein
MNTYIGAISLKNILVLSLLVISASIFAQENATPLSVVNSRMDAYNRHDLASFLKNYAEDVQVFTYPNIPLGNKGKSHLKSIFEPMFKEAKVRVKIIHQIAQGRHVINHEIVSYDGSEQKYVSIYEVENGLIKTVRFVRE